MTQALQRLSRLPHGTGHHAHDTSEAVADAGRLTVSAKEFVQQPTCME